MQFRAETAFRPTVTFRPQADAARRRDMMLREGLLGETARAEGYSFELDAAQKAWERSFGAEKLKSPRGAKRPRSPDSGGAAAKKPGRSPRASPGSPPAGLQIEPPGAQSVEANCGDFLKAQGRRWRAAARQHDIYASTSVEGVPRARVSSNFERGRSRYGRGGTRLWNRTKGKRWTLPSTRAEERRSKGPLTHPLGRGR